MAKMDILEVLFFIRFSNVKFAVFFIRMSLSF